MQLFLAEPRGFCAGVARAVEIVEAALQQKGAPVYVRHEIVHNQYVVKQLAAAGAVFVEHLDEIPDGKQNVIFSAHGVAPDIIAEAEKRGFHVLDATCPLVSKVHIEVRRHKQAGRHIFLIGHRNHPEMIGTIGHIGGGGYTLIETIDDARKANATGATAYATQTTLSVSETEEIIAVLKARFPDIATPNGKNICYATTNRQAAVSTIAPECDWFFILGAENSSNAKRLVETAKRCGAKRAQLINHVGDICLAELTDDHKIGLSAGASTPEFLVVEVINALVAQFDPEIKTIATAQENISFKIPAELNQKTP